MTPPVPPDWKCPRRVGFLFPHACHRSTPVDCPDCGNGQIVDPYAMRSDRYGYDRFDYYADDYFLSLGSGVGSGAADSASMDFTEADGADLVTPGNEFENDMTES
jgi:hypothetical protein